MVHGEIEGERHYIFSHSSDMWTLGVIGMMRNMDVYQMFSGGAAPQWGCSTVELRGSATRVLFFQSWGSAKHAHYYVQEMISIF
jgi:hypothetical protein